MNLVPPSRPVVIQKAKTPLHNCHSYFKRDADIPVTVCQSPEYWVTLSDGTTFRVSEDEYGNAIIGVRYKF